MRRCPLIFADGSTKETFVTVHEPRMNFATQLRTGRAPVWPKEVADLLDALGPIEGADEKNQAIVAFLADLAGGGPALELAIGAGRIALPLAATGIRVDGIDNSPAMVDKLRTRPGGDEISITIDDFANVGVDGTCRLIYLVANTLGNLLTQENQVRCFENVAAHLTDDGVFVVEAGMPGRFHQMKDDQYVHAQGIDVGYVALDVTRHDPVNQTLKENHVILTKDRVTLFPIVTRYVWPSEMDLMARLAGLKLKERWGGWKREPLTSDPRSNCISVYGR
jgi:SAM-dependent methyltransferase